MNIIVWIMIFIVLGGIGFILWDKRRSKLKWEKCIVAYSEVVGNKIVEHDTQYIGLINYADDIFKIPKLKIILPVPQVRCFVGTKNGNKKLYLIKLESQRYGFRIPSMANEVYIQKRDERGNLMETTKGKPVLALHKWKYCDDVVEPDVKHWDENIMEKLRQKHRTKSDILSKWIAPIVVAMILITGLITINMTTKYLSEQLKEQRTLSVETAEKVEQSSGLLQNLIKRVEQKSDSGG